MFSSSLKLSCIVSFTIFCFISYIAYSQNDGITVVSSSSSELVLKYKIENVQYKTIKNFQALLLMQPQKIGGELQERLPQIIL